MIIANTYLVISIAYIYASKFNYFSIIYTRCLISYWQCTFILSSFNNKLIHINWY